MHDGSFKSVTDQCDYIKHSLSNNKSKLYSVVVNLLHVQVSWF